MTAAADVKVDVAGADGTDAAPSASEAAATSCSSPFAPRSSSSPSTILGLLALLAIVGPILDSDAAARPEPVPIRWVRPWTRATGSGPHRSARTSLRSSSTGCAPPSSWAFSEAASRLLIGMVVGFSAGYFGGWLDEILNMVTNIFLVIPTLAVLLVIAVYLPSVHLVPGLGSFHARSALRGDLHRAARAGHGPRERSVLRRSRCDRVTSSIWRSSAAAAA